MTLWFKACCLAALAMVNLPVGATSLAPKSAQSLEGSWWLFVEGQPEQGCVLQLRAAGQVERHPANCAARWLGQVPTGWVSKPDGLALLNEERRTLLVFNPDSGSRYRGRTRVGNVMWLERRQAQPGAAGE